jgi:hypothetical protein
MWLSAFLIFFFFIFSCGAGDGTQACQASALPLSHSPSLPDAAEWHVCCLCISFFPESFWGTDLQFLTHSQEKGNIKKTHSWIWGWSGNVPRPVCQHLDLIVPTPKENLSSVFTLFSRTVKDLVHGWCNMLGFGSNFIHSKDRKARFCAQPKHLVNSV